MRKLFFHPSQVSAIVELSNSLHYSSFPGQVQIEAPKSSERLAYALRSELSLTRDKSSWLKGANFDRETDGNFEDTFEEGERQRESSVCQIILMRQMKLRINNSINGSCR